MNGYTPEIENPYPEQSGGKITEFVYLSPVVLYRGKEANEIRGNNEDADYVVACPYLVKYKLDNKLRFIEVPQGMLTDLASVPWGFRWLVGRVGPHLEASIVHDYLYIAWQDIEGYRAQLKDWAFANKLMGAAMAKAKVVWWRRIIILMAVWIFGWIVYFIRNPNPRYVEVPDYKAEIEAALEAKAEIEAEDEAQPAPDAADGEPES